MMLSEYLRELRNLDKSDIDRNSLVSIDTIQLDPLAPAEERMEHLVSQMHNPYCFLYKGTMVRIRFSNNDRDLDKILIDHFSKLKNC